MSQNKLRAKLKILCQQDADLDDEKDCVERHRKYYESSGDEDKHKNWLGRIDSAKKLGLDDGEQHKKHKKHNCPFLLCLDPNSTYQRSKAAEQRCKKIGALVQEARRLFEDISLGDQNEAVDRFEYFNSIEDVLDKILGAVQCPSINTIRVFGESGTGKTMLVREVKRIVRKQKLFDAVVMASVNGNPTIQDEIARDLGLSNELALQEASNQAKVIRLPIKNVLLILDDIGEPEIYWKLREKLPLKDKNQNRLLSYKILLITRDSSVLFDLSEIQFEIKPLEEEDAWTLFQKIATYQTENRSLPFYAKDICKRCNGLPFAVSILAKALKSGKLRQKTALQKLPVTPALDFRLLRIYDCLQSSNVQQTFLLCSLMGHNAAVQDLLKYTMGMDLFPAVKSVEEARDALLNSMTRLRNFSFLLDRGGNMHFDMHDRLMIFAKSVALGVVGLNNWKEMEKINWIYLSNTSQLGIELNCPKLTFFHLSKEDPSKPIPPGLFTGTGGLRVLGLTKTCSMPQSISLLNDLHTLRLDQSVLRDADMGAVIGKLLNLQVLSLVGCDLEELPEQIGQLAELKLLDLSDCTKLKIIPLGVLSRLSRLEELYMRNSFNQWAMEVVKEQGKKNATLSELKQLWKLTAIEVRINIRNIEMIIGGLFSENLTRYKIFQGDMWHSWDSSSGSSKILKLGGRFCFEPSVKKLLKKTEELHLQGTRDVPAVNDLDEEDFQNLKYLFIQDARNVESISWKPAFPVLEELVLRNLENMTGICRGSVTESHFSKLRKITVETCNQLKNLFSYSIAKNLLQLQEIRVTNCKNMEEIVDDKEQGGKIDKELWSLRLEDLPNLIGFNSSCKKKSLFEEQVASSSAGQQFGSFSAGKLKKLIIKGCDNLEYIFSSSMAQGLNMLEHLEIRKCRRMKEVIFTDNNGEEKNLIVPQLNILEIEDLEDFVNFYSGKCIIEFKKLKKLQVLNCPKLEGFIANTQTLFNEQVEFPNLEFLRLSSLNSKQIWHISSEQTASVKNLKKLFVEDCGNLEYLLRSSMIKSFEQLRELKIFDCKMMEGIIKEEERMCEIFFPKLDTLELEDLPKLTRFKCLSAASIENVENTYMSSLSHGKSLKQLVMLKICDCEMMEAVIDSEESNEETIFFPELLSIEFVNLPKLTRFYHAESSDTPPLFNEKVGFPKLKILSLSSIDIQQIWQISIQKISLEKLFVKDCGNLKYLFLSSMVKSFEQLIVLKICDCKMMEQVIGSNELVEEEMMCGIFFSKLDTLELEDLPKLARLCHGNYSKFKFSKLRRFTISKCAVLKTLIGDNTIDTENVENTYAPSLFDEKVEFPKLEQVIIKFMGSWYKIWDDKHDVNSCCQLNSLTVDSCEKLLNIFPFSMLERVRQKLETLEIQNCDSLEEIFGASQPQAQITTQPTNLVEIVPMFLFPELTHINLSKLPKLKGFVPQIHINELPSLKQVQVHGCDEVQIFALEHSSYQLEIPIQWISKRIFLYKRTGRICYMLPARHLVITLGNDPSCWRWFKPDPRFPEVAELLYNSWFEIHGRINTRMLSPKTCYKAYLVFKLADKPYGFGNTPIVAAVLLGGTEVSKREVYVQAESGTVGNGDQYPKERGDNWFEVELGEIEFTKERGGDLEIHLLKHGFLKVKCGVIIQGMEIRPN
ncbi:hypothetical protein SLEP1_g53156 [Rubroshorea leprosula]|uniref:Uncharacterized protein n=1 Tax=Rubroshorea leprosula TaxID=152421 RepID=A0AAV5M8J3_9ROSI|nr:hypothetical protein SLEP1_g53156 [Rubroshorea leprosula]